MHKVKYFPLCVSQTGSRRLEAFKARALSTSGVRNTLPPFPKCLAHTESRNKLVGNFPPIFPLWNRFSLFLMNSQNMLRAENICWIYCEAMSIKCICRQDRAAQDKTNIGRNKPGKARSPEFICHPGLGVKLMLSWELCQPIRSQPGSVRTNERTELVTPRHGDTSVTAGGERKWLLHRDLRPNIPQITNQAGIRD